MQHSSRFIQLVENISKNVNEVTVDEVKQKLDQKRPFVLVDVREDSEWEAGHLPNAIHLSKGIIERDIEKVIPSMHEEIVLYCAGGYRSAIAAESLQKMGYTKVSSMAGGYKGWITANYKTSH